MAVISAAGLTLVGLVAGLLLSNYLPGYFGEKGKNLATKEDIREITRRIEEVRAELAVRLHIHQIRYKNEFDILLGLSERLVALRDATQALRPDVSYGDPKDPEVRKERMQRYREAGIAFYAYLEPRQPFFPQSIYQVMKELENVSWKEFVQYKNNPEMTGEKYWADAEENGAIIGGLATMGLVQIRERAQFWEAFDPVGPK